MNNVVRKIWLGPVSVRSLWSVASTGAASGTAASASGSSGSAASAAVAGCARGSGSHRSGSNNGGGAATPQHQWSSNCHRRQPFQLFGKYAEAAQDASANGEGAACLGESNSSYPSANYSSSSRLARPHRVGRRYLSGRGGGGAGAGAGGASPTRHAFSDRRLVG